MFQLLFHPVQNNDSLLFRTRAPLHQVASLMWPFPLLRMWWRSSFIWCNVDLHTVFERAPPAVADQARSKTPFFVFVCFSQEFLQTEMHHVRTLKILLHVYMYELRQRSILDEARLFCGVESILMLHQDFLSCLKARQSTSQEDGSPNVYQIAEFADILISQVSPAGRGERQRKLATL